MKRVVLLFLVACMSAISLFAGKLPKGVGKTRRAVASVVTYKQGVMLQSGTAVFAGSNSDLIAPYSLFVGADSAVVIDYKGVVRPVKNIVGVNEMFDCIRVRVATDKKVKPLAISATPVVEGETLYQIGYGIGNSGFVEEVSVERVDSVYSYAYYTLAKPMEPRFTALPMVNADGELVAVMQEAAVGDTVNSYAIAASLFSSLNVTVPFYGNGYYRSMGIRTALPGNKDEALTCLYMQTMVGDSVSYKNVIDDFVALYPDCYEGYVARAEYEAVVLRDFDLALSSWNKALGLVENPAEVHYSKAKAINTIVLEGDTVSHAALSLESALCEIDKAIAADSQSLFLNGKAEILCSHGEYATAAGCYEALAATDMRSAEVFAKASQCYREVMDYEKSVAMLDSAVACFDSTAVKFSAPYVLTRALVNAAAKKYRNAVYDYIRYEEMMGGSLGAQFYYLRAQAEQGAKMYAQALDDYDTAMYLDPQNLASYIEKGVLCYRVKYTDEGIRVLTEAEVLAPTSPDVHYLLGRLYIQKGVPEKAMVHLQRAAELGHPDADAVIGELDK